MADMNPLADILNGTAADATDVQANFQTIETYINGTNLIRADGTEVMTADLDVDGNKIVNLDDGTAADDAVNKGQMDAAIADAIDDGVWTDWTPVLTQLTTVAATVTYAKYARIGRTIHFYLALSVTGSGVSNNSIRISLPVAATAVLRPINGMALFVDSAVQYIKAHVETSNSSASQMWFYDTHTTSQNQLGRTGSQSNAALASPNSLKVAGSYEAAS